ncbi:hypothetical protein FisN_27Hh123 [Fistulifera solaris]|jgi:hypothetical protein|uniref:Uncharacterized protein n=1 Tax=Fistulifera solaris TaxID=1519565 RepID=A0A1Z5KPN3_FISSO|nr:hypothetical protein FisN_27Hh123 [Fistulifera solaris]|eukprot:GAX28229.1 hypothetical protein FisN_27Hh123 [Fistulifera solaris]
MAPPPPSKSYLWKFDDDSSTASSSTDDSSPSSPHVIHYHPSKETKNSDYVSSTGASATKLEEQQSSKSRRNQKNKRKKKNKKKNKHIAASPAVTEKPAYSERRVTFNQVVVREFKRCLGEGVPGDGGWPLGMEMKACFSQTLKIEDYETAKAEKLQRRWKECYPDRGDKIPETLETRPFDYKRGVSNLLFRSLPEHNRMKVLLASGEHEVHHSSSAPVHKRRARSKSVTEEYSDDFPQVDVLHVRNELENIRASRTMEGHTGCTCRKLHVYIPPPGGGGKKAHSRRLSVHKVIEELRKRHKLPTENKSREELELLLHSIVAEEPCCTHDCPCTQNGINCQVDACSCWLASHMEDKKASNSVPNKNIRERCGNRYGMYAIDESLVDAERRHQIRMYCQVIGEKQQ